MENYNVRNSVGNVRILFIVVSIWRCKRHKYIFGREWSVSCVSMCISSTRILAVFIGKQGINTYRNRGKCELITYNPRVEWISDEANVKEIELTNGYQAVSE